MKGVVCAVIFIFHDEEETLTITTTTTINTVISIKEGITCKEDSPYPSIQCCQEHRYCQKELLRQSGAMAERYVLSSY